MFAFFERRLAPYPEQLPDSLPHGFVRFLWLCCRGCKHSLLALALLTACEGAFEALLFGLMGTLIDRLGQVQVGSLWTHYGGTLVLIAGMILASPLIIALRDLIKHQTLAGNFPMRLRWQFHRLLLEQSMGFYHNEFAGRIAAKVMQTAGSAVMVVLTALDILPFVVVYLATLFGVMGQFDARLLWPLCLWLLYYLGTLAYFIPRMGKASSQEADTRSAMTGRITDAYTNISTVKLFSHTSRESAYAREAMQTNLGALQHLRRLTTQLEFFDLSGKMLLLVGASGLALALWNDGAIGIGAVAAMIALVLRLNGIAGWAMWTLASLFEHVGTVQDGLRMLSLQRQVRDLSTATDLTITQGDIRFEQVCFEYVSGRPVLQHFDLHIRPGEKIGLVGRSGSGKSTLVNLLLRFYDLQSGRILIDGQDIAQLRQTSLRHQIGMVTQDTSLLHRSIHDNIAYGRPDATRDEVIAAARRAEVHDLITQLADAQGRHAYDVLVGERGVKLSGGQRQRVAIARVFLKNAPVLLLDEATSALDSEVERAIQQNLGTLMEGKTVVAIAHRLSTIAAMDRLVVLDAGRIVEVGTHRELLARNGTYARLWTHQSGGFLGET